MTAWQWLKLEWPWAALALLFGAVVLGICVRFLRNRRATSIDVDQELKHEEVMPPRNEEESVSTTVLDPATAQADNRNPETEENLDSEANCQQELELKPASQIARDLRIRAEIEALHKARVEQRQRIEAKTLGRASAGNLAGREPVRPQKSNYTSKIFTATLRGLSASVESCNGLGSATTAASSNPRSQTETAEDFRFITDLFDDPSPDVRNVAARALYHLHSDRAASFTRALREASPERRRRIGAALASSGLATEALTNLAGRNIDKTYDAFSVLFLMAKAGELQSLVKTVEDGPNLEVRLAVVKLLALSGQPEVVSAFRRLAVRSVLPPEVRSAVMEAIHQIRTQA